MARQGRLAASEALGATTVDSAAAIDDDDDNGDDAVDGVDVDCDSFSDDSSSSSSSSARLPPGWFSWRSALTFAGPGALMSIAFLDPGNLESSIQAASRSRYSLLWLLAAATFAGWLIQLLAVKLGAVTGRDLAESCRLEYSRPARVALWLMAEVAIVGADVQEVVGSALALALLSRGRLSLPAAVVASAVSSFALLYVEKLGVRHLEALFAFFIGCMGASFAWLAAVSGAPLADVARGFLVPRLPKGELSTAVAIIGAVVMPSNLYLHSALVRAPNQDECCFHLPSHVDGDDDDDEGDNEVSGGGEGGGGGGGIEQRLLPATPRSSAGGGGGGGRDYHHHRRRRSSAATDATTAARAAAPRAEAVAYFALESGFALVVALAINACLIVAVAAPMTPPSSASSSSPSREFKKEEGDDSSTLGLADAGAFLASKYGPAAAVLWGVGLLAAGQSSTMCGAYAGQHVMAGLLRLSAPAWARVAGARALAVAPTLFLAVTMKDAPGAALDAAAQALNVVQAVQLPFALIPLIRLTASERVMGTGGHRASPLLAGAASAAAAAVLLCNAGVAAQFAEAAVARGPVAVAGAALVAACYVALAAYLAFGPAANGGVGAARDDNRRRRSRSRNSRRRTSESLL